MFDTLPLKIDLPFIDRKERRNSVKKECYIILHDNHIEYKNVSEYETNEKDELVWEAKKSNWRFTKLRSDISAVSMCFDNANSLWHVSIDFKGTDPSGWFFDSPKDALKVYNQLSEYFISKPDY